MCSSDPHGCHILSVSLKSNTGNSVAAQKNLHVFIQAGEEAGCLVPSRLHARTPGGAAHQTFSICSEV